MSFSLAQETQKDSELTKQDIKEEKREIKNRSIQNKQQENQEDALVVRLQTFDRRGSGRITIFDTVFGKDPPKKDLECSNSPFNVRSIIPFGLSYINHFACCLFDASPVISSYLTSWVSLHLPIIFRFDITSDLHKKPRIRINLQNAHAPPTQR